MSDPTIRPDREGAEREICDAIDGVLQWRESATSWGWPEDEYHEMARAALDAIGYDELIAVAETAKAVRQEWADRGDGGCSLSIRAKLLDALDTAALRTALERQVGE